MKKLLLLLVPVFLLLSCKEDSVEPVFVVNCPSEVVPAAGGTVSLVVEWENCRYKLSTSDPFVSLPSLVYIGRTDAGGTTSVEVTLSANTSVSRRTANLLFEPVEGADRKVEVAIVQEAFEPLHAKVSVDSGTEYQVWDGFGAMNDWGDTNYWSESEIDLLMGTLALRIMRIRIPVDESHWANLVPGCKYAVERYGARILATPWTMPASMKDNGDLNARNAQGETSHLLEEHYNDYALYLEKFAAFMKDKGAPLYAISVQNEPDWPASYEGCIWSAEQHLKFVRDYGHLITSALLVTGESLKSDHSFYNPVLEDETACANIDIVGGHLYGATPSPYSLAASKGKALWMTEHLLNDSWSGSSSHWDETMDMLREIHGCLISGWNAYIWWYGRRYYSFIGDGEQGASKGTILARGRAYGQYSSCFAPGSVRVAATVQDGDGLLATACKAPDGSLSLVLLNTLTSALENVEIDLGGTAASVSASYTTESGTLTLPLTHAGNAVRLDLPSRCIASLKIK